MKTETKRKIILGVFGLSLSLVFIVLGTFIFYRSQKPREKSEGEIWTEQYRNGTGYDIRYNESYKPSNTGYPDEFNELIKKYKSVEIVVKSLDKYNVEDTLSILEQTTVQPLSYSREDLTLFYSYREGIGGFPSRRGDTIYFYIEGVSQEKYSIIKASFVDSYLYVNEYSRSNEIDTFIENHRGILGQPQVVFVDHLYSDLEHDFYFDKGLGFSEGRIILLYLLLLK